MKTKVVLFLALIAMLAPLRLTATASTLPPDAAPDAQQVLSLAGGPTAGPYLDEDLTIYNVQGGSNLIQEPLVVYDPEKNKLNPVAATSWSVSADKLTWTFNIRKGLVWSDGLPLTAEDYANALRNQALPKTAYDFPYWTTVVQGIKNWSAVNSGKMPASALGVAAPSPYVLQITTDAPRSYLPAAMVYTWAEPAHVVNKVGNNWATAPNWKDMVFSGPYMVQNWQAGVAVTLVRNPSYHGTRSSPWSKIIYNIPGGNYLAQFQTGQISAAPLSPGDLQLALHSPSLKNAVVKASTYDVWYLTYNTYMKPFDDVRVRQAFNLAVDRKALTSGVLKGTATPNYSLLMPGFPGYDPSITVPYDPAKAKQLLAAAGYPNGKGFPQINIEVRNSGGEVGSTVPAAEFIQSQIKTNLGITNLGVKVESQKVLTANLNAHKLPLVFIGYNYDYVDASDFLDLFVTGGRHAWSNAAYDAAVKAGDHSFDPKTRALNYAKAQKIMADQVPASYMYVPTTFSLGNPKIANWPTLPQQTDDQYLKMYVKK